MTDQTGIRTALADVAEFHRLLTSSPNAPQPTDRSTEDPPALVRRGFRYALSRSEWDEYTDALMAGDVEAVADALADLTYTLLGSMLVFFGPERAARVWDEVHVTNMNKAENGVMSFDPKGKLLKPEDWSPPNITGALNPQFKMLRMSKAAHAKWFSIGYDDARDGVDVPPVDATADQRGIWRSGYAAYTGHAKNT